MLKFLCGFSLCLSSFVFADINTAVLLKDHPEAHNQGVILPIPDSELDTKWTLAYQEILPNGASVFEWVPKGETIHNWSELIQVQYFPATIFSQIPSPADFASAFGQILKEKIPLITYTQFKKGDSVIVEWRLPKEYEGEKPQAEIATFISGPAGVYRLAYTKKTSDPLDQATKDHWMDLLSQAKLAEWQKAGVGLTQP